MSRRRDNLTWTHHYEVAPLEPAEQDRLLALAEEKGWSVRELRKATREPAGDDSGAIGEYPTWG